ncbi:hypothetical protein LTR91_007600 [Friedmanniomyces endolithicus]|uniref:Ubiquitin-like protease family profile domain-containing protein n=1 Tax=Friedmanniomyces endolithicus TaxID=329885 RepID=A0AAN6KPX4_9PEZI|nr:hypothetical protein LTS02_002825 [Friedmanniomyces endolithicus]KAK0882004.1 hypothetical protein LTR87_004173 [Friedmanniomyces endolithicus]KAK0922130.1 hypothetical protein LTR57_008048 [Friedmanniomyces endolithicus]KAK0984897.1 hypothetical protein LTS01_010484 [Friedmanniomyces endolithicus]KAK0994532.1 hypothetical protein LTR91_007600 [Friedmanniomyces endolithicus]
MPTLAGIGGYLVELALGKTSHGESTEGASQSNAAGSGTNKSTSTRFPRSLELSRGSNSKVSQRESDVDEIEEVHPFPGRRGGVKRGREQVDGLELPGAKRKAWPIEGERRLVGRDGAIPTEKMVGRPTYEGNSGLDSTGRRGKSIGRGFRPVDTLNKKYHASPAPGNRIDTPRRGTTSVNGHIVNPLETRKATDRSPMSSSMASNVQRESCRNLNPSNARADGSHIGPSLKKQKMEHLGSTNGVKSDPVDLTEPDDDEAVITAKVRRVVGPTAQSTSSRRSSPHHSSPAPPPQRVRTAVDGTGCNNAFANSNEYYKSGKPKNSRHRSGPRGTRNSSQTPSVISLTAIDGAGLRHSGNRAAPVTWEESESVGMESRPTGTRSRRTSQTAPMQLIHLDDGVTDLATGKVLQGSDADLKHASRLLSLHSAVRGHMEKQHKAGLQPRPKSRDREVPLERVANGWRTELGKHDRQTEQKKLDQTFVRDPPARALANGAKARDSVRDKLTTASAEDSPVATEAVDTSLSSVDELQGGNNIVSQALPSVSPNTKQSGAARAGTPSDLKPTKFTQSKKSTRSQQSAKEAVQQDDERMSVTPYAIYTVACCSVNRWGRIVYDARAKKLDIYDGDLPVVLPGGGGIVSIGPREAHRIYVNKDSNRVYLMGGATQTSIGRICIAFKEYQDVEWFHERLMSVTEDSIAVSHLPYDKLETTFAHQAKDIQKAHDNKAKIRADQQTRKIGLHNGGGAESEDETIQYDDVTTEEQPVRTGRRDAMLAAHVKVPSAGPSAPAKDVRSHYFHQEGGATRRSTREKKFVQARVQTPSPERWSRLHNPKRWSKPVEYPQQSARRVTVDFGDIERLDEGQFLNDNLISFGLRKIQEEMAPEHRESVHFFNSFFYTSLTTKNGRKSLNYDSVKKWTKGKDLLSTPYVVVPINIDLHWYAAIICNLDQLIRQAGNDEEEERQGEDEFAYFEDDKPEMDAQPSREHPVADSTSSPTAEKLTDHTAEMKKLSLASSGPASPVDVEVFEFGEHGVVQPTSHHDAGATSTQPDSRPSTAATKAKKGGKKKFTPAPRRYSTDTPAIITLDSFGLPHTAEVRNLKEYIIREAEDKRGMLVDRDDLYGVSAKGIPQQANFCDCGVYLLAYVEQFAKDPRAFVEKVLSKAMEEDQEFAGFNPSGKRAEIRNVLLGLNETQEAARKEMKKAKSGEKKVEAADTAAVPAAAAAAEKRPVGKAADMKSAAASDLPPAESAPVLEGASNTRPSAETSAPSLPVEARKASKPAKMAETAASNTKSPAWNIEEGDELDVAPARPLAQAAVSDPMEPAAVHAVHNVDPTRFHDFDEEEMLDGNTDPNADNSSALNVEPAHLGKDLLAPLEDVLVQNGGTEARAATTKSLSPETKQSLSEVQAEEDLVEQGSQQPLELSSRLAEVADSQEEVRVVAAAPKRAGTHTKFVA